MRSRARDKSSAGTCRGAKGTPSGLRPSRSVAELSSATEVHWRLENRQVPGVVVLHPSRSLAERGHRPALLAQFPLGSRP
jgi:hypothetical protein